MTTNASFKRGQVVWAIWNMLIAHSLSSKAEPVQRFHTRIKRILEIDNSRDKFPGLNVFAFNGAKFTKNKTTRSGVEVEYTAFDAFCLSIAVQLLDIGMKQFDTVFFIKTLRRDTLRPEFEKLLKDFKTKSWKPREENRELRMMLVPKHEITERFTQWDESSTIPLISVPIFCSGLDELNEVLSKQLGYKFSSSIMIEIGQTTANLLQNLARAPEFKRGRT